MFLSRRPGAPPAPSGPVLSGAGIAEPMTAKSAGRWIVDAARGIDSDTGSLMEAVINARDGDAIMLRPGVYAGSTNIAGKSLSITGTSADPAKAVIVGNAADAVTVAGATVSLTGLTVRNPDSEYGCAVSVKKGRLLLRNVRLEPSSRSYGLGLDRSTAAAVGLTVFGGHYGIKVADSDLLLEASSLIDAHWALLLSAGSRVLVRDTSIEGGDQGVNMEAGSRLVLADSRLSSLATAGVVATGPGTGLRLRKVAATRTHNGLQVYRAAHAEVVDSRFSDLDGYGVAAYDAGTTAEVRGSTFTAVKIALHGSAGARIRASDCAARDSRDLGASAYDEGEVELDGCLLANSRTMGGLALKRGRLVLRRSRIEGTTDAGLGVDDGSSASLEDVSIGPGTGAGVAVARSGRFEASRTTIAGHGRCGLQFPAAGGEAKLRDVVITRNECAISFGDEGARVDSVRGDFRGNRKQAFIHLKGGGTGITGTGNKTR